jgi:hypothetical protein
LIFPGFAFAYAMNSATDFTGSDGLIDIMFGEMLTSATAVKSFAGSYDSLL